tara:strand:- start:85 stop:387 length:303 start_codon:yes stop_codon:yes gene_type:complete
VKKLYSYSLIILLFLPIFLGLAHAIFEQHNISQETELNIHEKENDCSYCSLYLNLENNYAESKEFSTYIIYNSELVLTYIDLKLVYDPLGFSLRGPPIKS